MFKIINTLFWILFFGSLPYSYFYPDGEYINIANTAQTIGEICYWLAVILLLISFYAVFNLKLSEFIKMEFEKSRRQKIIQYSYMLVEVIAFLFAGIALGDMSLFIVIFLKVFILTLYIERFANLKKEEIK